MQSDLERVCDQHLDRFDCPDALIHRAADGRYGLIVHDGGTSFVTILICPWCGSALHDGAVEATIDGSADSEGVEFDLAHALAAASDPLLTAAAHAQWQGDAVRPLLELAGRMDQSVAAELERLHETERTGDPDADWWVEAIAADQWLRTHRPRLAHAASTLLETSARPGRRLDVDA
jgi:hypothetical protein